jgi:hypothetical protein
MLKQDTGTAQRIPVQFEKLGAESVYTAERVTVCGALALIVCIIFMAAPLQRLAGSSIGDNLPDGRLLVYLGSWLPSNWYFGPTSYVTTVGAGCIEFLTLMAVAFVIYGTCLLLIHRFAHRLSGQKSLKLIWLVALVAGLLFVCTPSTLSHDALVYGSYGRLINVYHANPYFEPFSLYKKDPLYSFNDWSTFTAAYGPLWMAVCSISAMIAGTDPLRYILFFRLLGLAVHLMNTLLVARILQKMGRSSSAVTFGVLLYAWNPLVLLESSQGAHNDVFMLMFILLGILFAVRAELDTSLRFKNTLLPTMAFTLAALVKYTTLPLVALFIIFLVVKVLRSEADQSLNLWTCLARRWKPVLRVALPACLASGILILAFYLPFYMGYSLKAIIHSFTLPPSSQFTNESILNAIDVQVTQHPFPSNNLIQKLLVLLDHHARWEMIDLAVLLGGIIFGACWFWRKSTTRTFAQVSLLTLGVFLMLAPWLLPWYMMLPVALAAVSLPMGRERFGRGLIAFALVFSLTAGVLYLNSGWASLGGWTLMSCLLTFVPPLAALFLAMLPWPFLRSGTLARS